MGSQECVHVYLKLLECCVCATDEFKFRVGQMYPLFADDCEISRFIEHFVRKSGPHFGRHSRSAAPEETNDITDIVPTYLLVSGMYQ